MNYEATKRRMKSRRPWVPVLLAMMFFCGGSIAPAHAEDESKPVRETPNMGPRVVNVVPAIAVLSKATSNGFSNGGWNVDRYKDLKPLNARRQITIADLEGPGIIRQIYIGKHHPFDLMARGVVLEIYFEDSTEPAVVSPVADFFGDGCNGKTAHFAAEYFEHYPECWSCYWPMPFRKRARVILRNDTDKNTGDYSFVEWERVPELPDDVGYFHATFARKSFQLSGESNVVLFEVAGAGHVVGRQFSIQSDEPLFQNCHYIMEGNNEIDIDGVERVIDYLGTECSFNFGWGWPEQLVGPRAGAPYFNRSNPVALSTFRLHHHFPIRFRQSLRWSINYGFEPMLTAKDHPAKAKLEQALAAGGGWVDFATVHYWYQGAPAGFQHEQLPPVSVRQRLILGKEETTGK